MNPVVKAQVNAFSAANSDIELDVNEFFEVFSIYSISNGILNDNIDPFLGHLEGSEFGIDGVTLLVQGELCTSSDEVVDILLSGKNHSVEFRLFQSKTSKNVDYGNMSKFFDASYSFFSGDFLNPTEQLTDLLEVKDYIYGSPLKENPTLTLYYVTTGKGETSDQIQHLIDATQARFSDLNIFDSIRIRLIGAKDLQSGYRSATNSNSESVENLKPITLPEHPSVEQAFLGYVTAEQLIKLATIEISETSERRINRAVFFDNVRDFNEKSEINLGILEEIKSGETNAFVFKNNGVTVVAKSVSRQGDTFELDDYQIVNGCQTSNILYHAKEHIAGIHVPFRLIVSDDPDFVSTIIVGINRQNEVKEDQFWALTPFMKDLEEFCREQIDEERIFIERRENQYRNETVERTKIIKPSELLKSVAAMFMFQPHRAARDYRGIRKEYAKKLFQDQHSVEPYHAAAFANYKLDFAIRNKRVPRAWGIYRYYVLFTLGKKYLHEQDVFFLKKSKQTEISRNILNLVKDEDRLVEYFTKTANILDELVKTANLDTREKVRDFIRSESVSNLFEKTFFKDSII